MQPREMSIPELIRARQSPDLDKQIAFVAALRQHLSLLRDREAALRAEWEEQNRELLTESEQARQDVAEAEAELRALTLGAYKATGSKKPAPGVGVRIVKSIEFDEDKALHWCVANQYLNCLSLNRTTFKKVAEGLGPDFVTFKESAQATIAKEL